MSANTKSEPLTLEQALQPKPVAVDLDAHQADMARRKAERDAKHDEMMKCCNSEYAKVREDQKPLYLWTVEAEWYRVHPKKGMVNYHKKRSVVAQNERDAWAMFCDKLQTWPSPRESKATFKRGKQMTPEEVIASAADVAAGGGIPRIEFKSNDELAWVEA